MAALEKLGIKSVKNKQKDDHKHILPSTSCDTVSTVPNSASSSALTAKFVGELVLPAEIAIKLEEGFILFVSVFVVVVEVFILLV
jgi:hypothetical protein